MRGSPLISLAGGAKNGYVNQHQRERSERHCYREKSARAFQHP